MITEQHTGCSGGSERVRRYEPTERGYVAADGSHLSQEELDALRARVLASRPGPNEGMRPDPEAYLASLGFDDATLIAHVPELAGWMLESYRDERGNLPPGVSDLPLFEVDRLRAELLDYLLRAWRPSTDSHWTCIDIPGNPWIHVGTTSDGPELVPWFVVAGEESWSLVDHDVARALLALGPWWNPTLQGGTWHELSATWPPERAAERKPWREELWTNQTAWRHLAECVHASVNRHCYRLLPGWKTIEQRFLASEVRSGRILPNDPRRLPCMVLRADGEWIVDEVHTGPGAEDADWNDVLDEFERVQGAATRQPCLVEWKRSQGVALALEFRRAPYDEPCEGEVEDLVHRLGLAGLRDFQVSFGFRSNGEDLWDRVANGLLFEDGTLLILHGLRYFLPPGLQGWFCSTGRYGLVRPGGELEVQVVTSGAR